VATYTAKFGGYILVRRNVTKTNTTTNRTTHAVPLIISRLITGSVGERIQFILSGLAETQNNRAAMAENVIKKAIVSIIFILSPQYRFLGTMNHPLPQVVLT